MTATASTSTSTSTSAQIYVCKSSTCRRYGSDATLLDLEDLASLIECRNTTVHVQETSCLGYCSQGPAVAVRKTVTEHHGVPPSQPQPRQQQQQQQQRPSVGSFALRRRSTPSKRSSRRHHHHPTPTKVTTTTHYHVKMNTFHKRTRLLERVTGQRLPVDTLMTPAQQARRQGQQLQHQLDFWTATYQWNKALACVLLAYNTAATATANHHRPHHSHQRQRQQQQLSATYTTLLNKAGYPTIPLRELVALSTDRSSTTNTPPSPPRCFEVMPSRTTGRIDKYVLWTLTSIDVVSQHSAIFHFRTEDRKRGSPHPRGRGRRPPAPITWHVTMLGELDGTNNCSREGPLPWLERDYTPISTAKEWEQGSCQILIKIYHQGAVTSWLHQQDVATVTNNTRIWLSVPIKTLSVPTLTSDNNPTSTGTGNDDDDDEDDDDDDTSFQPASVLLLLAGTGIVAVPQILAHRDPYTKLGIPTRRSAQLPCPIDLIHACRDDDILLLPQIKEYCVEHVRNTAANTTNRNKTTCRGLRNYTLLLTEATNNDADEVAPYADIISRRRRRRRCEENDSSQNNCTNQNKNNVLCVDDAEDAVHVLQDVPNATVLLSQRLNLPILIEAIDKLIKPYRIVISGPTPFNSAAKGYLVDDCDIHPSNITVLSA